MKLTAVLVTLFSIALFSNTAFAGEDCSEGGIQAKRLEFKKAGEAAKEERKVWLNKYFDWHKKNCAPGQAPAADKPKPAAPAPAPAPPAPAPTPAVEKPAPTPSPTPAPAADKPKADKPAPPKADKPKPSAPAPSVEKPDPPSAFPGPTKAPPPAAPPAPPPPVQAPASAPAPSSAQSEAEKFVIGVVQKTVKPECRMDSGQEKPVPPWFWVVLILGSNLLLAALIINRDRLMALLKKQPIGLHYRVSKVEQTADAASRNATLAVEAVRDFIDTYEKPPATPPPASPPDPTSGTTS